MKIPSDESGQATILVAVFMAVLMLGLAALAIDVGMLYREKRMVQNAADAAAIAASAQYGTTAINAAASTAALQQPGLLASGSNVATITATLVNAANSDVQVVVTQPTPTVFMRAFNSAFGLISVSAMAEASKPPSPACITSLSPKGVSTGSAPVNYCAGSPSNGLGGIISGNSSFIKSTGCTICSDSSVVGCNYGGTVSTNETVNAGKGVYGNVNDTGTSAAGNCTDPYAAVTKPTPASGCDDPPWMLNAGAKGGGGSYTIGPGTYCNFNTQNVKSLTMTTGIYIIKNTFATNSGTTIVGNGVTLYFAPGSTADASSSVSGGATPYGIGNGSYMTLTALTTGTTAGIAIWDDSGTAASPDNFTFNGGSGTSITGAIYAPHGIIQDGNGSGVASVNGGITAWAILTGGSGTISVTESGSGTNTGRVTLVK